MNTPARNVTTDPLILEQDPRWAVVKRVVSSACFCRSTRLSQFLLYVCERTILGLQDEINEQQVGVHVFDRPPDYNSSEDNIVRTQARLLRKKLEEYYATEGMADSVRIVIPKGGYVAEFRSDPAPPAPEARRQRVHFGKPFWLAIAVALLLCCITFLSYQHSRAQSPRGRLQSFWGLLVNSHRATVLVPSDTSLVLYQIYTGQSVNLDRYVRQDFWRDDRQLPESQRWMSSSLGSLPYGNVVDLNFCWALTRSRLIDPQLANVRYARDLRMGDLKGVNAVLIGARRANPWVELFDRDNNFQGLFDQTHRDHIRNRAPRGNEPEAFIGHPADGVFHSYAVVAFVRGLTGEENALILSGTGTAGTEGASDFVLNEQALGHFLERITRPNGEIPHFEVVLDVESVVGSSPRSTIVAYRVHKD